MTVVVVAHSDYLVRIVYRVPVEPGELLELAPVFVIERLIKGTSMGDAAAKCAGLNREFISRDAVYISATCEAVVK